MEKNMMSNYGGWIGAFILFILVGIATVTFGFKKDKSIEPKKFTVQQWYHLNPTSNSTNPNNQNITGNMSSPPASIDPTGCAINSNTGNFCGVLIEFQGSSAPTVTSGTVQDVLNANTGSAVVSSVGTSGYSRLP